MKLLPFIISLIIGTLLIAQPGDPRLQELAENRRRNELIEQLNKDPKNPKLLWEKVNQDFRHLNIDFYRAPNRNHQTELTAYFSTSAAQLDELIGVTPENPRLYLLRARYHYYYSDVYRAIEDFSRALELSKERELSSEIYHLLSICYYHIGIEQLPLDMEKTLESIDSANNLSDNSIEPYYREKIYYLELAKKEDLLFEYYKTIAIKYLDAFKDEKEVKLYRFNENFGRSLIHLYQLAEYCYKNKKYQKAIEILNVCIDACPRNKAGKAMPNWEIVCCHYLLSKIYREPEIDDYEKAVEHILLTIDEPKSWMVDEHELKKDLDFFLERSPNNADLQLAKAVYIFKLSWLGSRNTEEYLRENMDPLLEKAIKLGSQSHKIPLMLAIRNRVFKHHDEALIYAEEAVKLDPDNYNCQSELFEVMRNFPKTEEKVYLEIKKKIDVLFYDEKPDFKQLIKLIKNLK